MIFRNKIRYSVDTLGADVLRQTAAPIPVIDDAIRQLAEMMTMTLTAFNGIGLAAPQVGRSLRLVVLDVPLDSISGTPTPGELELLPKMPFILVNPEIVSCSDELAERDEGCLSVPEIFAPVIRPAQVVLRAQTLDNSMIMLECGGLLGRCIQHELDHLNGRLFIDRVKPEDLSTVAADLRRLEKFGAKHDHKRVTTR